MPSDLRLLTMEQFQRLLGIFVTPAPQPRRRLSAVHLHHTWRPRRIDFRGAQTIEAMRDYHMKTNGWSDIAQHLTIDPFGGLWTGRNWNQPPASSKGANGTAASGPFMIEVIGDFDAGSEPFDGAQRAAAIEAVARILKTAKLAAKDVFFHRELGSPKSCPGTGIDKPEFVADVKQSMGGLAAPRAIRKEVQAFPERFLLGYAVIAPGGSGDGDVEIDESRRAGDRIELAAAARTTARQLGRRVIVADPIARGDDWSDLLPHVVNLSRGELSEKGEFKTTPQSLADLVDAIEGYVARTEVPRVLLYAHGGLVNEHDALDYARKMRAWWLDHGVYPVFFVWETGLLETIGQYLAGPRDIWDVTTDPVIEVAAKIPGSLAWGGMKESARRASLTDTGHGSPGAAFLFVERLVEVLSKLPNGKGAATEIHAVGHSAGSIFHAHLLPLLMAKGRAIQTLSLLAPAARTNLFSEQLLPSIDGTKIRKLSVFTMEDEAERQDNCVHVYHKSLLYLVSHAFEGLFHAPILGLERSIKKDDALVALFKQRYAELQLSHARGSTPNPLTDALHHGDFDNNKATMCSVLRRVLALTDDDDAGKDDFPFTEDADRAFEPLPPPPAATPVPVSDGPDAVVPPRPAGGGRRTALCIGINAYSRNPLSGCVDDARAWKTALESLGFSVQTLFDGHATRAAMVEGIRQLVQGARAGDQIVLQYSGHGTQLPDENGDEADGFDEALVPVDFDSGAFLIDDDLALLLAALPSGALATLFMDCCHSGTNSRFAPIVRARTTTVERVRFLPASADLVEAHLAFRARLGRRAPAALEKSLPGVIHFAACQDNEYAWESAGHGDFTVAATAELASAVARGDTNESFARALQQALAVRNRQHPALMSPAQGMSDLKLLGGPA